MKYNFGLKKYKANTPLFFRTLGDAILYGCGNSSIVALSQSNTKIAMILFASAMIGKFLSDLFAKQEDVCKKEEPTTKTKTAKDAATKRT